jgi:hypothetical protein
MYTKYRKGYYYRLHASTSEVCMPISQALEHRLQETSICSCNHLQSLAIRRQFRSDSEFSLSFVKAVWISVIFSQLFHTWTVFSRMRLFIRRFLDVSREFGGVTYNPIWGERRLKISWYSQSNFRGWCTVQNTGYEWCTAFKAGREHQCSQWRHISSRASSL